MNQLHVTGTQRIGNYKFVAIEGGFGKDKKAMTVKDIALIHRQPLKEINRRINDNRSRFKDGLDIIDLKLGGFEPLTFASFGFNRQSVANSKNIYILSERGYAKLLKILEDDTAWEIYDQLVDNYFNMRQQVQIPTTQRELARLALAASEETNQRVDLLETDVKTLKTEITLTRSQQRRVNGKVKSTVIKVLDGKRSNAYKDSSIRTKCHKDCYKQLWECFDVSSYMDIPKIRFEEAMDLIPRWKPTLELQAHIDAVNGNGNIFDEF